MIVIQRRRIPDGGWVALHEDVTAHRHTEAALREQHGRFDAAITNISCRCPGLPTRSGRSSTTSRKLARSV
jgi:hypothetical protein